MNTFEITIQRAHDGGWPVVVRHQPGPIALTTWAQGTFDLDLKRLDLLLPADRQYGTLLGQNIFRAEVRDAFVRAVSGAKAASEPLRVWLIVEAEDLRSRHWEQLCAPFEGGRWDYLLLNQQTPFSLYLPSQIERRFPPIGRRDLRALLLVAGPEDLAGDYSLASFDVPATVAALTASLGNIPHDVLATSAKGNAGEPNLNALSDQLTTRHYTLLLIVSHGAYRKEDGETILYFPEDENRRPVTGSELIERLSRLEGTHGLPHLTFLSTCESADPQAENGLGGLGQRLVRELGMPAVLAMTDRVSIETAQNLSESFCTRLVEHGEVDRALAEALTALQARYDLTVPALFSRLGGRPLFSDALDRELTAAEIRYGLEQMDELLEERAPVLIDEFHSYVTKIQGTLDTDPGALSQEARREREAALAKANQLSIQTLDISFNALALGQKPPEYDPRLPFRGLYPFRVQDREFFFGRQALVDQLVARLTQHNFLAVLGPSGCGKSSLVLAGLIPAMDTPMAYMTPGGDPLVQLESALEEAHHENILVVDQFEELFTLCTDEAQREAFLERLLKTTDDMRVVITMRADFLGECAAYPGLRNAIEAHQALIGSMTAAGLRLAMERQADHVGLRFEAGLGEQILDDVQGEPGAMPLLQHALLLLWQRRHGRWLRWEEYTAIGGIQEAIAHTAEEVYAGLKKHEKVRVRDIFIRLTRPPEGEGLQEGARYTRRRVRLAELVPAGSDREDTIQIVNCLADARLVVTQQWEDGVEAEVEVAHEALIQHWPRLINWLDENRADIRLREALTQAARDWESVERDAGALYRGIQLVQAKGWVEEHPGELNVLENEFLVASQASVRREEADRERRRNRILISAIAIAVVMAILGLFALNRSQVANQQAATAEAASTQAISQESTAVAERNIAATAQAEAELQAERARAGELAAFAISQLDRDPDLAFLLAVEAYNSEDTLQSHQALFESWIYMPQLTGFMRGHDGRVTSVAWSSDGRLASGSSDGTLIVWDPASGQPSQDLQGHKGGVNTVAWSPNGRLASGSFDETIIIWDLESGQPAQTLRGTSGWVNSVAWSDDGRLAVGSRDGAVILWDPEHPKLVQTLEEHEYEIWSVAWSPDGRLASSSCAEFDGLICISGEIMVWDLESSQPAQTLRHEWEIFSIAWLPDGRLASDSGDRNVIVWDLESSQPAQILQGHSYLVTSVAWSPDGRLASSSCGEKDSRQSCIKGEIILWDLKTGRPAQTWYGHSDLVTSLAWSPDGRLASSSCGEFDDSNICISGEIIVWDSESGQRTRTIKGPAGWATSLVWSSDGRLTSSSCGKRDSSGGCISGEIVIWDLQSSQPAQTLQGREGEIISPVWSPDGRLASGSADGKVIIWNLENGRPTQTLLGHKDWVSSVAWSDDGRLASSSCGKREGLLCVSGEIIIWDLESGQPAQVLRGHLGWVAGVAWSPDGRLTSSSCGKRDSSKACIAGEIILWDLESSEPAQTLVGHEGRVTSVAWSGDGRLASGSEDGTVIVWDLVSGQPAHALARHEGRVTSVTWSPDGRRLASGSFDKMVIVWDLASRRPAQTLQALDLVSSVSWSPEGSLAYVLPYNSVSLWEMNPAVWIDQVCQRAGRNLAQAEWAQYFPGEEYRETCPQWPPGE